MQGRQLISLELLGAGFRLLSLGVPPEHGCPARRTRCGANAPVDLRELLAGVLGPAGLAAICHQGVI